MWMIQVLLVFNWCIPAHPDPAVVPAVTAEIQCCMTELVNGSVSYTLNHSVPQHWITTWTKDDMVIVGEDGKTAKDVLCPTENGYIMKEKLSKVVCNLESPEDGVSENLPCTDWCKPARTDQGVPKSQAGLIIGVSAACLLLLLALVCFVVYMLCQRNCRRDNSRNSEMQPVPDRDQNEDLDDPDHHQDI